MKNLKRIFFIFFLGLTMLVAACEDKHQKEIKKEEHTIRVGVIYGAEERFMHLVKKIAAEEYALNIEVVPYVHFSELNEALNDGDIDTNVFQNMHYFKYSRAEFGYRFSTLGNTYIFPMEIYSKKIKHIAELKKGAVIAIPDEPTEEARALLLLEKLGKIKLKPEANITMGVHDIISNPNRFQIVRLPVEDLARMLPTVDVVVLDVGYALPTPFVPFKNLLAMENLKPEYSSMLVVRQGKENDLRIKALLKILQSPQVEKIVLRFFYGQALPGWK